MKKCFKILSVLLFAISLCACVNSQLNDNNVNNENKQEKFELKGKWYGQEDHCIEFLDDENAIFNCEDIKDYQLKYIYNEDLNTIELKWTMSLNIEIKNDNGTYYLYLGMRDEVYVKESDKDYANTAYTNKIKNQYKELKIGQANTIGSMETTVSTLNIETASNNIVITGEINFSSNENTFSCVNIGINNLNKEEIFFVKTGEETNIQFSPNRGTLLKEDYLSGNTYITFYIEDLNSDLKDYFYVDITDYLK